LIGPPDEQQTNACDKRGFPAWLQCGFRLKALQQLHGVTAR